MKFIHISDLHLGKHVNGFSMLTDQRYILTKIINIIDSENPEAVLIAGDVYDKSVPSGEAVMEFDSFLKNLAQRKLKVFIISGNHDSAERLSFASSLIDLSGIHISPVYKGNVEPFVLTDEYGKINIYMLPFIKPTGARAVFEGEKIESYTDAVNAAIKQMNINTDERNIIVTHQFVTGALRSESEEISVGGTDNVDITAFEPFDYVALGHIHRPQKLIYETVRYCGSPLKYSFSEAAFEKSVPVVEMKGKGDVEIKAVPLTPRYDMREIKGKYDDIVLKENYENTATDDYMHITLTDEEDIPDVINKLRVIYPNLMKVDYDNTRTRTSAVFSELGAIEKKTELELFSEFFEKQNGQPLTSEQEEITKKIFEELKEA